MRNLKWIEQNLLNDAHFTLYYIQNAAQRKKRRKKTKIKKRKRNRKILSFKEKKRDAKIKVPTTIKKI